MNEVKETPSQEHSCLGAFRWWSKLLSPKIVLKVIVTYRSDDAGGFDVEMPIAGDDDSLCVKVTRAQKAKLHKLLLERKEACDYLSAHLKAASLLRKISSDRGDDHPVRRTANMTSARCATLAAALHGSNLHPFSHEFDDTPPQGVLHVPARSPSTSDKATLELSTRMLEALNTRSDRGAKLKIDVASYLAELNRVMTEVVRPGLSKLQERLERFRYLPTYDHIPDGTAIHCVTEAALPKKAYARKFEFCDLPKVMRMLDEMTRGSSPLSFLGHDAKFLYVFTSRPDLEMWLDERKTSSRPARYVVRKVIEKLLASLRDFHAKRRKPHGDIAISRFYVNKLPGKNNFEVRLYGSDLTADSSIPEDLQMVAGVIEDLASKVQWTPELKLPLDDLIRCLREGAYPDAHAALQAPFFTASDVPVLDTHTKEEREDVTATHRDAIQYIIDKSCSREKLTIGRDQRDHGFYNHLEAERIEKVKNPLIWNLYQAKRTMMSEDRRYPVPEYYENTSTRAAKECCPNGILCDIVNEGFFWHGTKAENVDEIAMSSFMTQFAERMALGKGIYFAQDCSKADQYSCPSIGDDLYPFIIARVCMGSVWHTRQVDSYMTNPPFDNQQQVFHESVSGVVNRLGHIESVIYDNSQAYPAYIVWCRRTKINSDPIYTSVPIVPDLF